MQCEMAMPLLEGLSVIRSSIHGYGVRADRMFRQGEIILYGDGILYRDEEEFDDTYALVLPGYEVDARGEEGAPLFFDLACQSRWINHSCDSNTLVETEWNAKTKVPRVWWEATRDILAGEELTYDYAFAAEVAEPCFCRSAMCRGVIVDPDELHLLNERLRGHLRVPVTLPIERLNGGFQRL